MDEITPTIHSFVIRFIQESTDAEEAEARGVVTHVQSAETFHFTEWEAAVRFMRRFVRLSTSGPEQETIPSQR